MTKKTQNNKSNKNKDNQAENRLKTHSKVQNITSILKDDRTSVSTGTTDIDSLKYDTI